MWGFVLSNSKFFFGIGVIKIEYSFFQWGALLLITLGHRKPVVENNLCYMMYNTSLNLLIKQ